jgi:ATP-dependent helicase/nuclease subunit A
MMTPEEPTLLSSDALARQRLREELESTFFVEAGAGTGKTTALVTRIVALVASGRLAEMERLAAITFTEAAAGELRARIRRDLEREARDAADEAVRTRCRRAAVEVDLATIQTIHSFAATLLRTFPIEAGLPPGFEVLDQIQSDLAFEERFRAWLHDEIPSDRPEDRARREMVRRALLLGLTFRDLRDLAHALQEQADLLTPTTTWPREVPPDPVEIANAWGRAVLGLRDFLPHARQGEADVLVRQIRRVELAATRLADARDADAALAALQGFPKPQTNQGNQNDWNADASGTKPVRAIKETLRQAWDAIADALAQHRRVVLADLLAYARDFTLAYAAERRRQGQATFHDLLTWARDLLRDDPGVRARAQRRFARIFVDEFQDTDPLQAEIVWFLVGDPDDAPAENWWEVRPVPGKLFVVGDPKQSIYRFRRADVGIYSRILATVPSDQCVVLSRNFRSLPPILAWVNFHFARRMVGAPGVQARYVPLSAAEERPSGGAGG